MSQTRFSLPHEDSREAMGSGTQTSSPAHGTSLSRRGLLGLGAGAAAVLAGGLSLERSAAAAPMPAGLAKAFDDASAKHAVPRDLLVALATAQTGLDNHGGGGGQFHAFGITGLSDATSGRDNLAEAARLTGADAERLKTDDAANIAGAAALLASHADKAGLDRAARGGVEAWHPVLAEVSGYADLAAMEYADSVYDALARGVDAPRQRVRMARRSVEPNRTATLQVRERGERMATPAAELKSLAGWAPADPANYTGANRPNDLPINKVIIHTTEGSYSSAINWFQNPAAQASAHYVIRSSDGQTTQCVSHLNIAWHAGNWEYNQTSIGIEHEAYINESKWYTDAMYKASAKLVNAICKQYGIPMDRSHILGHSEVPGATHTDPGSNWDWNKYMGYVTSGELQTPWSQSVNSGATRFSGSANWKQVASTSAQDGKSFRAASPDTSTSDAAWFKVGIPSAGAYKVDVWNPGGSGLSKAAPHLVATTSGTKTVMVDQSSGGSGWRTIGNFTLAAGDRNVVGVSRWTGAAGQIAADAVRVTQVD